jgi:hypothetical protein
MAEHLTNQAAKKPEAAQPAPLLFFVKTPAGNSAFCNRCLGRFFITQKLFDDVPEEEGGPLLLTEAHTFRFAKAGDLMATCDHCDTRAQLIEEVR